MSTPELMAAAKRCREAAATEADCQLLAAYAASGGRFSDVGGIGIGVATSTAAVVDPAAVGACAVALTAEQLELCRQLGIDPAAFVAQQAKLRAAGKVA